MKCVALFFLSVFSQLAYAQNSVEKIEFNTLTRGSYTNVLLSKDCITIVKQARTDTVEKKRMVRLKKADWQSLVDLVKNLTVDDIAQYESPTKKRAFDGAWHSTLIITLTDKSQAVHSFDDENPHEKLQPLMHRILELIDKAEAPPVKE